MKSRAIQSTALFLSFIFLVIALFFTFAPDHRVEKIMVSWRQLSGDKGQTCLDAWKSTLRDPQSAQLISSDVFDDVIFVTYRATNSFGTFLEGIFECPLRENGEVNTTAVVLDKTQQLLEALKRQ